VRRPAWPSRAVRSRRGRRRTGPWARRRVQGERDGDPRAHAREGRLGDKIDMPGSYSSASGHGPRTVDAHKPAKVGAATITRLLPRRSGHPADRGDADDDADRQAQHGSKRDRGSDAHMRGFMAGVLGADRFPGVLQPRCSCDVRIGLAPRCDLPCRTRLQRWPAPMAPTSSVIPAPEDDAAGAQKAAAQSSPRHQAQSFLASNAEQPRLPLDLPGSHSGVMTAAPARRAGGLRAHGARAMVWVSGPRRRAPARASPRRHGRRPRSSGGC
jgi:hypothetical protein